MRIIVTYKIKDNESINEFELTPEQYFDPIIEGENYEVDSIPKFGDTIDYIKNVDISIMKNHLDYKPLIFKD